MYSSKSNGIEGSWSFIFLHRLVDTRPICITILLAKLNDSLIYLLSPHTSMSVWLLIMRSAIMKKLYSVQTTVVFVMTLFSFLSELSMKLLLFFVFFKFFGHATYHVGSWFPDQGLNPCLLYWKQSLTQPLDCQRSLSTLCFS